VFYRLAGDEVSAAECAGKAGEAYLAEDRAHGAALFRAKDDLEPVPARELLDRAKRGPRTVLDVRPQRVRAGHLPAPSTSLSTSSRSASPSCRSARKWWRTVAAVLPDVLRRVALLPGKDEGAPPETSTEWRHAGCRERD